MKKLITIFFLLSYATSSIGTTVNLHYCMGEYMGSNLFHSSTDKCPKCGMKVAKSKGCCKDEQKLIKLQDEHKKAQQDVLLQFFFAQTLPTPFYNYDFQPIYYNSVVTEKLQLPPPPLISTVRLHLLNCVFRI